MEVPLVFIVLFVLIGSLSSFLIATFSYLSQHRLNELLKTNDVQAIKLNELRNKYEESLNSLFLIEFSSYVIAAFLAGNIFFHDNNLLYSLLAIIILILLIVGLRIIFYSVGIRFADYNALKFTKTINLFIKFISPLVFIRKKITDLIGGDQNEDASREELTALVESALEEGTLDEDEYRILTGIMKYSDVLVSDVMTPRTVVFSCDANKNIEEVSKLEGLEEYSRFPIWEGDNIDDDIIGYVLSRDVYVNKIKDNGKLKLKEILKPVYMITENSKLDIALETFLEKKQHLFVVLDEYGGFAGILTMEDVLETILGAEIVDEADKTVDLRNHAKRRRDKRLVSRKKIK